MSEIFIHVNYTIHCHSPLKYGSLKQSMVTLTGRCFLDPIKTYLSLQKKREPTECVKPLTTIRNMESAFTGSRLSVWAGH